MFGRKLKLGRAAQLTTLVVIGLVIALVIFWPSKVTAPTGQGSNQTPPASVGKSLDVATSDFHYTKPAGWATLAKADLDAQTAASGIFHTSPAASFTIKVSGSTPASATELKNSTLDDIKKNAPNFTLLTSTSTKVDGQSGQVFGYTFTDKAGQNKLRQQLSAIPYKGKTYFLLFSSLDSDYDKQATDFGGILASFKFK